MSQEKTDKTAFFIVLFCIALWVGSFWVSYQTYRVVKQVDNEMGVFYQEQQRFQDKMETILDIKMDTIEIYNNIKRKENKTEEN